MPEAVILRDQVILVSGGAGRLGSGFSREIVRCGGRVVVADVDERASAELRSELGDDCALFTGDLTIPSEIDRAIEFVLSCFGQCNGAVHSAYPRSAGWGTPFEELEPRYLFEDLNRQLGGTILFAQRILRHFLTHGGGSLVLVSSIQGIAAPKFEHYEGINMTSPIEYSVIKAGVTAVARYLAKYHKGANIRVNAVSPGGIKDQQPVPFLSKYRESCINKGMLDPEDVAGSVVFLLSSSSRFINGQNIVVDDGWSL
jgi:NAD(P)-dependent dehydrogenase (short-subunit alcohol dehydrogenase family)